jgi:hypothetical protein
LLPFVVSSQVVTNRSSFVRGSISIPMGRFTNPLAKAASVGESAVPNGKPFAGLMSIRRMTIPSKLVYSRSPAYVPAGTYCSPVAVPAETRAIRVGVAPPSG